MTMIDERRLWPLIEARAEATPDALMVLADEAERAARRGRIGGQGRG
jgi:hypothetical protein